MKQLIAAFAVALATLAHAAPAPSQMQEAMALLQQGKYAKSHAMFLAMANKGDTDAMQQLGQDFIRGRGVAVDNRKAMHWFNTAAQKGSLRAMTMLAVMHLEGRGTPKNPKEAIRLLQQAADKEEACAHFMLSNEYASGKNLPKSPGKAYFHMALAQRHKCPPATPQMTARLGTLLFNQERRELDVAIDKRTPKEFLERMKQIPPEATAPKASSSRPPWAAR